MSVHAISDVTTGHPESAAKYAYSKRSNYIHYLLKHVVDMPHSYKSYKGK